MSVRPSIPPAVRRARLAVSAAFLLFGLTLGLWFVHIPVVSARLALDPAVLGLALLNIGLGSLVCQPLAGILVARIGSKTAGTAFLAAVLAGASLPVNAPTPLFLFFALFAVGGVAGACNVALNKQASDVETAFRRPIMPMFHGFFSLGALGAAGLGSLLIGNGFGDGRGMIGVAFLTVPLGLVLGTQFLAIPPRHRRPGGPRFALPPPALLGLAGLAFLTTTIEFSVSDWSALYLSTIKGMTQAEATVGFAMFSLAMAAMRFAGGPAAERLGDRNVVAAGGLLVAAGMALVLLGPGAPVSAAGFLLIGIGAANLAPLLMSQANRVPGVEPSIGVAATATGLTSGILLGPPIIGFVAQWLSLPVALAMVGCAGLVVMAGALTRRWQRMDRDAAAPTV